MGFVRTESGLVTFCADAPAPAPVASEGARALRATGLAARGMAALNGKHKDLEAALVESLVEQERLSDRIEVLERQMRRGGSPLGAATPVARSSSWGWSARAAAVAVVVGALATLWWAWPQPPAWATAEAQNPGYAQAL